MPVKFNEARLTTHRTVVERKHKPAEDEARELITAVQRVWRAGGDTKQGDGEDAIMNRAHDIHQAIILGRLAELLSGRTIRAYLGAEWILRHPGVERAIVKLESALAGSTKRQSSR
jgi:hypothetical protein